MTVAPRKMSFYDRIDQTILEISRVVCAYHSRVRGKIVESECIASGGMDNSIPMQIAMDAAREMHKYTLRSISKVQGTISEKFQQNERQDWKLSEQEALINSRLYDPAFDDMVFVNLHIYMREKYNSTNRGKRQDIARVLKARGWKSKKRYRDDKGNIHQWAYLNPAKLEEKVDDEVE